MSTAFFIMAGTPSPSTLKFADALAAIVPDVYVVSDQDTPNRPQVAKYLYVPDEEARAEGFYNSSPLIKKTPIAWDKAIYYFARSNYDHAWFCEDDVLVSSASEARALVDAKATDASDLLCQDMFSRAERPDWWHWDDGSENFAEDCLRGSFLPICRMSKGLVSAIERYIRTTRSMSFIETMVPSLVAQNALTFGRLSELPLSRFRFKPDFPLWEMWLRLELGGINIYHPVKNDAVRMAVLTARESGAASLSRKTWHLATGPVRRLSRYLQRRGRSATGPR